VEGMLILGVTVQNLKLNKSTFIVVRIGVRLDTPHTGGINLFSRRFGNYPQVLVLRIGYRSAMRRPMA
jgi:predicted transcriptional regulator